MLITSHLTRRAPGLARRAAVALAGAVTTLAALAPGAANAGSYPMYNCNAPGHETGNRGPWVMTANANGNVSGLTTFDSCAAGSSFGFTGTQMRANTLGTVQLFPPASVSVTGLRTWFQGNFGGTGSPAYTLLYNDGVNFAGWGAPSSSIDYSAGSGYASPLTPHSSYEFWSFCGSQSGLNCDLSTTVPLSIKGVEATLFEGAAPGVSITGGSLITAGPKSATKTVTVTGTDGASGVRKLELMLDDTVVGIIDYGRDWSRPLGAQKAGTCAYDSWNACPTTQNATFTVDTTTVPDAAYQLGVRVTDAAGNAHTTLAGSPVVIENHPLPVNTELPAVLGDAIEGQVLSNYDGIWQNAVGNAAYRWKRCNTDLSNCAPVGTAATYRVQAADVGKRMELEVTRVNDVGSAVAATSTPTDAVKAAGGQAPVIVNPPSPTPGPAGPVGPVGPVGATGTDGANGAAGQTLVLHLNGTNASASASLKALFASSQRGTIRSAYGRRVLVTGRLLTPGGQAIAGAKVQVFQQDKQVGAALVPSGEVTTDSTGRFAYTTTAVRSRTIRFAYRTHLEDATFASTTDISLEVVAKITFSVDRHSLRNGQVVTFKGSIAGAPKNARKVVELQVRKGAKWMTFKTARLSKGRFRAKYRFTATHRTTTYTFRSRVRQEAGFPFLTGVSRSAKVTVRG